jgi:hypothetical protein
MRAYRGWIAAVLLTALAFIGGPDLLDSTPATTGQSESIAQRAPRLVGDTHSRDRVAAVPAGYRIGRSLVSYQAGRGGYRVSDAGSPGRRWMPALPPPSSQGHAPGTVRLSAGPDDPQPRPVDALRAGPMWHVGTCSQESLQVFRC